MKTWNIKVTSENTQKPQVGDKVNFNGRKYHTMWSDGSHCCCNWSGNNWEIVYVNGGHALIAHNAVAIWVPIKDLV